jgi:hypothetical protein
MPLYQTQTFTKAFAITTNDSTDLASTVKAIYCGGAGNIKVTTSTGVTVTFTGVLAGTILPVTAKRVFATGTTATNLVGLTQ